MSRTPDSREITLADVAHHAGVSLATASRVLHGSGSRVVGAELRTRVVESARQMRYIPNAHAQALAGSVRSTVGVITHDVADPYFAAIANGAIRIATQQQSLVMLASTMRDPDQEIAYVATLRAQRARAIVLLGSGFEDRKHTKAMKAELEAYVDTGGRVAMVGHSNLPFDCVLPDNRGGAAAMARALAELGHERIAIVTTTRMLSTIAHRVGGFTDALADLGLSVEPDDLIEGELSQEGGYAAVRQLLANGLAATAIFCVSDVMAIGALQALREGGVRVPSDVSLAGFDDIPIVRHLTPGLSTVALPLEQIGELVMTLASDEPRRTRRMRRIDAEVVLRGSTARRRH